MGSAGSGNFGHAGRPGLVGGSGPGAGDFKQRTFTHYSKTALSEINRSYMGTGKSSKELRQGVPFNKHISVYDESKGKPEPFTRGLVKNVVRGKFAVLDIASPVGQNLLKKSGGDLSRLNGLIQRAGWSGYSNSAGSMPHVVRLLSDVRTTKSVSVKSGDAVTAHYEVMGEKTPDRKVGSSSMGHQSLAQHTEFQTPVRVVVQGSSGYRTRVAEDVVAIDQTKNDIVFHRRYPGGRTIRSPYKSKNVTRISIRTSRSQPERNYFVGGH